jgi:uncharacterized RDD family membrane protein YckC
VSNLGPLPSFPTAGDDARIAEGAAPYAGWWRRVAAYLLDGFLVAAVAAVITAATGHHEPWSVFHTHVVNGQRRLVPIGSKLVFFTALEGLLAFVYAAGFLSSAWQATPFMRALGVFIATASDLGHVGLGRASGRAAIFQGAAVAAARVPFGTLLILVDLLWPLWDARNQTVHDKLAGTVVLRRSARP